MAPCRASCGPLPTGVLFTVHGPSVAYRMPPPLVSAGLLFLKGCPPHVSGPPLVAPLWTAQRPIDAWGRGAGGVFGL